MVLAFLPQKLPKDPEWKKMRLATIPTFLESLKREQTKCLSAFTPQNTTISSAILKIHVIFHQI